MNDSVVEKGPMTQSEYDAHVKVHGVKATDIENRKRSRTGFGHFLANLFGIE